MTKREYKKIGNMLTRLIERVRKAEVTFGSKHYTRLKEQLYSASIVLENNQFLFIDKEDF